jgi:hypothetical protein
MDAGFLEAAGGGITQNPQKPLMQCGVEKRARLRTRFGTGDDGFLQNLEQSRDFLVGKPHRHGFLVEGLCQHRAAQIIGELGDIFMSFF